LKKNTAEKKVKNYYNHSKKTYFEIFYFCFQELEEAKEVPAGSRSARDSY
jgi:hypothetical protein